VVELCKGVQETMLRGKPSGPWAVRAGVLRGRRGYSGKGDPWSAGQDEHKPIVIQGNRTEFRQKALTEQGFALGRANGGSHM
jgi:hypothetical protein